MHNDQTKIRTPEHRTIVLPDAGDAAVVQQFYDEGLRILNPEAQTVHLGAVAELAGEVALSEVMSEKIETARSIALAKDAEYKKLRAQTAAINMENANYAEDAPTFDDQMRDHSRTATFHFSRHPGSSVPAATGDYIGRERTEHEGLVELHGFLSRFLDETKSPDGTYKDEKMAARAKSILENLTFIGEKEYGTATRGFAALWKQYLDTDPDRQLVILTPTSGSERYKGAIKSDEYLRNRILDTFTDEEMEHYSGRIVASVDDAKDDPRNTRVVILDDWSVSGNQLRIATESLMQNPKFAQYLDSDSVEINLVTASDGRVEDGLVLDPNDPNSLRLPVRTYFRSHNAPAASTESKSHITGLYSSVNSDFGNLVDKGFVKIMRKLGKLRDDERLISLVHIVRPYVESMPKLTITRDKLERDRVIRLP